MRKAVIDVGSNSVLLTIEERGTGGWQPVEELTSVTSLGEGTKATGVLGEAGMERTLQALELFFRRARELGSDSVAAYATMAARIAANADEFLRRADAQGTPVAILSGEDEAQLGFEAVANDPTFADFERLSIIDPGGQSTELVTAERTDAGWNVLFRRSFAIGTLALRSGVLQAQTPDYRALLQAVREIDDCIGLDYLPNTAGRSVVLGATGTNLISIRERMDEWDPKLVHGQWLDYEEVSKAVSWLSAMTDEGRAAVRGMEAGRERTIHIGALILERYLHTLRVLGCYVSVRGWRYALLERE